MLAPLYTSPDHVSATLQQQGQAVLSARGVADQTGLALADLHALQPSWNDLPPDPHMKDGGRYRRRRHSCFVVHGASVELAPHRAHWQPLDYNALHGGMQRWFEPMHAATVASPAWNALLAWLGAVCSAARTNTATPASASSALAPNSLAGSPNISPSAPDPWFLEAHQFRIDTTDGIGRPTPEGAHRDGVDFVAVFLVDRHHIKGGETRVFEAHGPHGQRFTLTEPWSLLLLDDARVIHESTPIQPVGAHAHRDTLVVTLRAGGFQGG